MFKARFASLFLLLGIARCVAGSGPFYPFPSPASYAGTGVAPRYGVIDLGLNIYPGKIENSGYISLGGSNLGTYGIGRWYLGNTTVLSAANSSASHALINDIAENGLTIGIELDYTSSQSQIAVAEWNISSPTPTIILGPSLGSASGSLSSNSWGYALDSNGNYWTNTSALFNVNGYTSEYSDGYRNGVELGNASSSSNSQVIFPYAVNNQDDLLSYQGKGSVAGYYLNSTLLLDGSGNPLEQPTGMSNEINQTCFVAGYIYNNGVNVPVVWDGKTGKTVTLTTPPNVYPQWTNSVNAAVQSVNGKLVPSVQVAGVSYLWSMDPVSGIFGGPVLLDYLIGSSGIESTGWTGMNAASCAYNEIPDQFPISRSINDNGLIIGTANYLPSGPNDPIAAGSHGVLLVPAELAVDADRNGTIVLANENFSGHDANGNAVDQTTQAKPFRFWVNNDEDNGGATGDSPYGSEVLPTGPYSIVPDPDCASDTIVSIRDLEDWTRLWFYTKGLNQAIHDGTILVGLKWTNVTGTPGIKLAPATDSDGSTEYLIDITRTAANAQKAASILVNNSSSITEIQPTGNAADFVFNPSVWSNLTESAPKTHFIFEGVDRGEGQLEIVFLKSDGTTKIGEGGGVWLDLRDIKEMYKREASMPVPLKPYNNPTSSPSVDLEPFLDNSNTDGNPGTFVPDPTEDTTNKTYIVFVHGYNMTGVGSTNYAESMFKRLWWRGYKGRFAAFRWNTYGNGTVVNGIGINGGAIGTYNDSEFVAWHSGTALKKFVQSLPSGYAKDIVSHSMGSIVVGEAIEEGMPFTHYAILHGAASASCYSTSSQIFSTTNYSVTGSPDTSSDSAATALAYRYAFKDINSTSPVVNFYDDEDTVVGWIWEGNNYLFKPQNINPQTSLMSDYYYYNPLDGSGHKLGFEADVPITLTYQHRYLTDFGEARAYADFSLTPTIGSLDTTTFGAISSSNPDNYFGDHHSNEFNWSIQQLEDFYDSLMNSFDYTPNSP